MHRLMSIDKPIQERSCRICGIWYIRNKKYSQRQWNNSKYCSKACGAKAKQERAKIKVRAKKICEYCGVLFYRKNTYSDNQWGRVKYCSIKCSSAQRRKYKNNKDKGEAYRRRNGLPKWGSDEFKEKMSKLTKIGMAKSEVQEKIRAKRKPLTDEQKAKLSAALAGKMPKNLMYANNAYPNIQRGYYDINGTEMFFRSKWEANYALYLDFLVGHKEIDRWEYEPDTFVFEKIKFGTRSYTPDFKIYKKNGDIEYHEVKGYMDSKSKTKLKRMAKYYPDIKIRLVERDDYNTIKKQIGGICGFY